MIEAMFIRLLPAYVRRYGIVGIVGYLGANVALAVIEARYHVIAHLAAFDAAMLMRLAQTVQH
jgi:hypothetical protein